MVKFRGVSKNDMTTAVKKACDLCVTQQQATTNVKKKSTELLYIQNKVSYV